MDTLPFTDFPSDVQLNILSFLDPASASAFAGTSRRSGALCASPDLCLAMLDRRWGSLTSPRLWCPQPLRVYRALHRWDRLIGLWRRIGEASLILFEWGASSITASRLSPDNASTSYSVTKSPFLWLGLSPQGDPVSYLRRSTEQSSDLVPVALSFMGDSHFVLDEDRDDERESAAATGMGVEGTSPPEEIYRYFANRTSPGGDKGARRQRRKERERERFGRRKLWESEHFVKIDNYVPTPSRPLQGLWKGLCEDRKLDFYLVSYDDIGGITCRRVRDTVEPFSGYSPVFWTSNPIFLEPPFSRDEEEMYSVREHIHPSGWWESSTDREVVSRILSINSSYDLVIPDLTGSSGHPRNAEGRIWVYDDMTFGYGFLRNNLIVDMKHVTLDGHLLDAIENGFNVSSV